MQLQNPPVKPINKRVDSIYGTRKRKITFVYINTFGQPVKQALKFSPYDWQL